jgi:preprotein translocase subunit SecG
MYAFITIIIIVICVLLALVVLIQNPKGGGVNATFGGASQQIFGASRTSDVIEKTTWTLAGLLIVLSITSAGFISKKTAVTAKNAAKGAAATTAPAEVSETLKRMKETGADKFVPSTPQQGQGNGQQQQQPAQGQPAGPKK